MWRVLKVAGAAYLTLVVLAVGGVYLADRSRRAKGRVVKEVRPAAGFSAVEVSGRGTLRLSQGDSESLTIEAQEDILPLIQSRVQNGVLHLDFRSRWPRGLRPTKPIMYDVMVRDLSRIETSGSVRVEGGGLETEELVIDTSGSADVELGVRVKSLVATGSGSSAFSMKGEAESQSVEISGSGRYEAAELDSRTCRIEISGSGKAEVKVSEELSVDISGSGKVEYLGNPRVSKSISGAGKVERVE